MRYLIVISMLLVGCATPHMKCKHLKGADYYQCKSYHEAQNTAFIRAMGQTYNDSYNRSQQYYRKPTSYKTIGNHIYGSDGTSCTVVGDSIFCD